MFTVTKTNTAGVGVTFAVEKKVLRLAGGGGDRNKDKDVWARFRFYFDTTHCYKRARLLCFVFYFHMKKMITPPGSWNAQISTGSSVLPASNLRRLQSGLKFLWILYNQSASFAVKEAGGARARGQL